MHAFCYVCGTETTDRDERSWYCSTCQQRYYDSPRPATDIVFFDEHNRVLLAKRALDPAKGTWDTIGGFIENRETTQDALVREIKEEVGLQPGDYSEPLFNAEYLAEYPWGKVTYDVLVLNYVARIKPGVTCRPADDVAEVAFFNLQDIDELEFGFPKHKKIITRAAKKLGIS